MKVNSNTFFDFSILSFNAGLLVKEMQRRKIKVQLIKGTQIIKASLKNHDELLYDIYSSIIPYPIGWLVNDKFYTKKFLELNNLPVVPGHFFRLEQIKKSLNYAKKIGFPVVLKPTNESHGDFVYSRIDNEDELKEKIEKMQENRPANGFFLIEKYFWGNEYRIFITKNKFLAIVWRIPANIVGDGKNSIISLIQKENKKRMNPRKTCLCEIRLDDITFDYLEKNHIILDYVPKKDERVFLRGNSNVSTGGNCYDVTGIVHPTVKKLALQILEILSPLSYVGIDLICKDISKSLDKQKYVICELNASPGLSLHMMPEKGKSKDTARALADLIFPETKNEYKI